MVVRSPVRSPVRSVVQSVFGEAEAFNPATSPEKEILSRSGALIISRSGAQIVAR